MAFTTKARLGAFVGSQCIDMLSIQSSTIGGLQDNPFLLEHALCESPL